MKSNPLFQDSTVSAGSNIQTHFELFECDVLAGDRVFLKLHVQGESQPQILEMKKASGSNLYFCSVWLEHLKPLSYVFYIKRGELVVAASDLKKAQAMHSLVEKWEASTHEKLEELQVLKEEPPHKKNQTDIVDPEEYIDDLIKKWDL